MTRTTKLPEKERKIVREGEASHIGAYGKLLIVFSLCVSVTIIFVLIKGTETATNWAKTVPDENGSASATKGGR